ncbi:asparagine synthase [Fragilaria crotonensis]|nr:asparagine synthase [Fragilaria crotonensis]
MCGIGVVIGDCSMQEIPDVLQRRGPDHKSRQHYCVASQNVTLIATVLHMRGKEIERQPKELDCGKLCWNGEIYQYMSSVSEDLSLLEIPPDQSDTEIVAQLLSDAIQSNDSKSLSTMESVAAAISRIWNGEFAFCFLMEDALYYGRDRLGRRSLLTSQGDDGVWKLSSVATSLNEAWIELPPGRVYEYNLTNHSIQSLPMPTRTLPPTMSENYVSAYNVPKPCDVSDTMWKASIQLELILRQAVHRRLASCHCKDPIGVMFSGGLDSAVLAAMAASLLQQGQTLELYNVGFGSGLAADRQAGLVCYQELQELYPDADMKLILVDIDEWESVVNEEKRVQQLIAPKTSVMDLNIGTALWFASRGIGLLDGAPFHATAKILILGMGADEQLGGYGRHRKAHRHGTLREELDLDINRIWERNMGRDDRLLSDHGKEARFPYLDPNVMQFLAQVPVDDICDFSGEPGQGDKRILRLVAQRMQLTTASGLVKRAIQFGSRIAHVSDKQRFGSRRQAKGTSHFGGKQQPRVD